MIIPKSVYASVNNAGVMPNVNVSLGNGANMNPNDYVSNIKILVFFTILAVLPSIIIMMTSFTRIVVVLSFLKTAMGVQQAIPTQILTGLSIFLTLFIMTPVYNVANKDAIIPYLNNEITQQEAIQKAGKPLKEFMLKQTRDKDLKLFVDISDIENKDNLDRDNIPFTVVIPAFAISELNTAFQIGFMIYLPFLVIDMVVASVLMSMGMFMLPPTMVSLPFKLILFVMVDGWSLLVSSLVQSFV
ncbi:flagellar type III secretion system pore protein FliP [Clostridium sp. BJN0001]|uniref:flagellar type III secretion system pore protein FliP n=1 Tax=Clostridium sp. BJN0001 TaxID=2930219 RepID=UPI001FD5EBD4|nr:flagellar type III secretion system pore protein FliP [Clostridium sp. BJN0001]